jgi:hypothetical protein
MKNSNRKPITLAYQPRHEVTKGGVDGRLVVGVMIAILAMMLSGLMISHTIW